MSKFRKGRRFGTVACAVLLVGALIGGATGAVAAPADALAAGGGPNVSSHFDRYDEGWFVVGDAQSGDVEPTYRATGGNGSGYVEAEDDVTGGIWYWGAPGPFLGDRSAAYDRTLSFDLRQSSTSRQLSNYADVVLRSPDRTLFYDFGDESSHPGTNWTRYEVPLNASDGWTTLQGTPSSTELGDGTPATEADVREVLGNLTAIRIRGEYRTGSDTGGLDNVVLRGVAPTATCPEVVDRPARDLTDDGEALCEDVNGDGQFNVIDVATFLDEFESPPVVDNAALFDFNGDGAINILDVADLLART